MSEKYKALRNAEKYVVTGKFTQAVKEYQKLLAKEPDEPTLLNTVGDLLLRQNSRDEALEHFRKAAEVYLRNGFLVKSIAVYKKIYQFTPAEPLINENLADLYQRQGLIYEASRHLKILIHHHSESGNVEQASLYLQRLAQLSPNSPETQVELAEILERRHDEAGAFEHYQAAAGLYLQCESPSQAYETAKKAIEIDPTDDRTIELYVTGGVKSGNKEDVRKTLKELIDTTGQRLPYEIFLAHILEEEGNRAGAHAKYLELEPLAYTDSRIRDGLARTLPQPAAEEQEVADSSAQSFTFDEPRAHLREVKPRTDWSKGGGERFEEQRDPLFDAHRSPLGSDSAFAGMMPQSSGPLFSPAAPSAPTEFPWQSPEPPAAEEEEEEPFEEEETPVEVEVTPIESLDEALQEADFYLKLGFREEAKKLLERLLRTYPRDERVRRRAEKVMTIPPEFDVAPEPVELFPAEEAEEPKPAAKPRKVQPTGRVPAAPSALEQAPEGAAEDALFEDFLKPKPEAETELPSSGLLEELDEQPPVGAPEKEASSGVFAPQDMPWEAAEAGQVSTFDLDLETGEISLEPAAAQPAEQMPPAAPTKAPEATLSADEEIPVLDLDFGEQAAVDKKKPREAEAADLQVPEDLGVLDLQAKTKRQKKPAGEVEQLPDLTRLAEFEKAKAPFGKPRRGAAPEPTLQTTDLIPLEELDEAPTARQQITEPEFDEEVDSALDGLFSGEPLEEAPEEVLRYDVAATGVSDEATNPKVHYDLGLAYKEMGLVEDAVQEFQTAAQMLKSPVYNPQRILCCSMLANSLLQLGHYGEAHRWAEEGLRIPGKKEFEWKALKYDSASALERQGKHPEALEAFREILDRDPEYRDVLTRIDNLLRSQ
jgi:pilus assembly protein FimV